MKKFFYDGLQCLLQTGGVEHIMVWEGIMTDTLKFMGNVVSNAFGY